MSAISTDWAPARTATPRTLAVRRSREEEFHFALESYIARYRKHHAVPDDVASGRKSGSKFRLLRPLGWNCR